MNLMNDLISGKIDENTLQEKYCDFIIEKAMKYVDGREFNEKLFESSFDAFFYLNSRERNKLFKLIKQIMPENLGHQTSRFSDETFFVRKEDVRKIIKPITDKMLVRRITNEICEDDLHINLKDSNFNKQNNKMYQIIERLGYSTNDSEFVPGVFITNYELYNIRKRNEKLIKSLSEIEERMKFLCDYLKKNPEKKGTITIKEIDDIMKNKKIGDIIKARYGHMKTIDSIFEENVEEGIFEYDSERGIRVREDSFKEGTAGGRLLEQIMSGETNVEKYEQLDSKKYDALFRYGAPIVKSGFKIYEQNMSLEFEEEKLLAKMEEHSKIISEYCPKIVKIYRKREDKDETQQDRRITHCMLLYDEKLRKKKEQEPGVTDTIVKAGKKFGRVVNFFVNGLMDSTEWVEDKVKQTKKKFDKKIENLGDGVKEKPYKVRLYDKPLVFIERIPDEELKAIAEAKKRKTEERRARKEWREANKKSK